MRWEFSGWGMWGGGFLKSDPERRLGVPTATASGTFVTGHIYHSGDRERSDGEEERADPGQGDKSGPMHLGDSRRRRGPVVGSKLPRASLLSPAPAQPSRVTFTPWSALYLPPLKLLFSLHRHASVCPPHFP